MEKYSLVIPRYQRGYKWAVKDMDNPDAESSVEYLIKTIIASFKTDSELFLQGITVSDSEKNQNGNRKVIIIDGQQRLTTMYLLLWALDKDLIHETTLVYDARKDTDICLNSLKSKDSQYNRELGDTTIQDIFFIEQAIFQIRKLVDDSISESLKTDFIRFIKTKIKNIYIPIARKEDAVATFTMMNGSKAIMRAEELIKSELLRLVSKTCQDFSFEATSVEDVLVRLREFTALDWNTSETRSRYAREWDRWLYWWNRTEVKTLFRTTTENRPLGLLLDFYYRGQDEEKKTYNSFKQFQAKHMQTDCIADQLFSQFRKLQKKFEDVYNDNYTYNMLAMALSCGERYQIIRFFLDNLKGENRDDKLKRYTEGRIIGLSHENAASYACMGKTDKPFESFEEQKRNFIESLLSTDVYNDADAKENAFRYLSYRNIHESVKLKERFNVGIFLNRSLEHIHPKSKVYYIDEEAGVLMRGDGKPVSPEQTTFPDPMPDGFIKRDGMKDGSLSLSEHSIGNLVLLYGNDNSEFGAKSFGEKKDIFFQVTDQEKIIISRTLQHTLSKFASSEWGVKQMCENYKESKYFLENDFCHE